MVQGWKSQSDPMSAFKGLSVCHGRVGDIAQDHMQDLSERSSVRHGTRWLGPFIACLWKVCFAHSNLGAHVSCDVAAQEMSRLKALKAKRPCEDPRFGLWASCSPQRFSLGHVASGVSGLSALGEAVPKSVALQVDLATFTSLWSWTNFNFQDHGRTKHTFNSYGTFTSWTNYTETPYGLPARLEWSSNIILRHVQKPAQGQFFSIYQTTIPKP